jgi:uncharacterized protein (TIGR02145 family)
MFKVHFRSSDHLRILSALFILVFSGFKVSAQAPAKMSYQAVVRNASNALVVNTPVKMRVSILQGSATGTVVFSEQHNPITNVNGLVSIEIGGGTSPSGSFTGIDWSKGPYFIKTETDPANGTNYSIAGISQLLSVPFAMYTGDVNSTLSSTGDTLSIGSKRYVISGIRDVSGIGVSATGITAHSCGAINVHNPAIPYGTMTDQEGNVYRTVQIGTQVWMAENLRTKKYKNGDIIPNITNGSDWINQSNGAYCIYMNNSSVDCPYGKLYNWYAVNDNRGICPSGWHMPSDNEWLILENFLGGASIAGGKLKNSGSDYWANPNTSANNSSGFSGLPGGGRLTDGNFGPLNTWGQYWTSTESETFLAWSRTFEYNSAIVFRSTNGKTVGFAIRCVKD